MIYKENEEKSGLVVSIGISPDPIIKSLEDAKEESVSNVYILYGRRLGDQEIDPLETLDQIIIKAKELGIQRRSFEVSDPEDFNSALKEVKDIIKQVKEDGINKLICNFTGGTKPMSSALVHGFLCAPLNIELYLEYVGGEERDKNGKVISSGMKIKRLETKAEHDLQQAIKLIKEYDYNHAYYHTRYFPEEKSLGFVKTLSEALYKWDNFHYRQSLHILKTLIKPAMYLKDNSLLSPLVGLILKVNEVGENFCKEINKLSGIQKGQGNFECSDNLYFIPAEALNNAQRRLFKQEYSEAVLRTYRAIEATIQIKLLTNDINPWKVKDANFSEEQKDKIIRELNYKNIPDRVALNDGFKILKGLGFNIPKNIENNLKEIQQLRNESYLEHGYQKVNETQARECYGNGIAIINTLLEIGIEDYKSKIDLRVSD